MKLAMTSAALHSPRSSSIATACARAARAWTWERASAQFLEHLVRARDGRDLAATFTAEARSRCQTVT